MVCNGSMVIEKHKQLNIISLVLSNNIWQMSTTAQNYYADGRSLKKLYREFTLADDLIAKINAIPRVIDNLESESATDALSANMGRVLKEMIDNLEIEVDDHLDINSENPVQNKVITEALTGYALLGDVNTKTFFMDGSKLPGDPDNVAVANEVLNFMNDGGKALIDYGAHTYVANKYPAESGDRRYAFYTFDTFSLSNDSVLDVKVLQFVIEAGEVTNVTLTSNSVLTIDSYLDAASNNPVANTAIVLALAGKANISYSAVEPQNPTAGDLWFNSETGDIKYYNGTEFVAMGGSDITVDDELSLVSENPVQNKIITAALNNQRPNVKLFIFDNENYDPDYRTQFALEVHSFIQGGGYPIIKAGNEEYVMSRINTWGDGEPNYQYDFVNPHINWRQEVDGQTGDEIGIENYIFQTFYVTKYENQDWTAYVGGTVSLGSGGILQTRDAWEGETLHAYMPTQPHQPASKKYVDDAISAAQLTPGTPVYDTQLDINSTNAVENQAIARAIQAINVNPANIKMFDIDLNNQADALQKEQDAVNFYYTGGMPVLFDRGSKKIYLISHIQQDGQNDETMYFMGAEVNSQEHQNGFNLIVRPLWGLTYDASTHVIPNLTYPGATGINIEYLSPNVDYQNVYTPQYDGSPATKKYVDDHMGGTAKYTVKQGSVTKGIIDLTSNTDATIQLDAPTGVEVDDHLDGTSENPVQNKVIKEALDQKMDRGSVPTPNNGRLTINQGNNTWTFTADQAGNTTINLEDTGTTVVNVSNNAYGSSWRNKTNTAPSQNAVYDAIENVKSTIKTPGDGVLTLKQGAKTLGTFSADANQNKTINIDSGINFLEEDTNLWELEPGTYLIGDPADPDPESFTPIKLYCKAYEQLGGAYPGVHYFKAHYGATLSINYHGDGTGQDPRNGNYYSCIDGWIVNYGWADEQRGTYREQALHQTDPYQLGRVSGDLYLDFHESTAFSMILTGDVTIHFGDVDDNPNTFGATQGYVFSLLIMQDDVGGHRITFDESRIRVLKASGYAQDTTRNSVSRLILDKQEFWNCRGTSDEVRMKHAEHPGDPDYSFVDEYYFASINRYS